MLCDHSSPCAVCTCLLSLVILLVVLSIVGRFLGHLLDDSFSPVLCFLCVFCGDGRTMVFAVRAGYGYESYADCPLEFSGIGNIHVRACHTCCRHSCQPCVMRRRRRAAVSHGRERSPRIVYRAGLCGWVVHAFLFFRRRKPFRGWQASSSSSTRKTPAPFCWSFLV